MIDGFLKPHEALVVYNLGDEPNANLRTLTIVYGKREHNAKLRTLKCWQRTHKKSQRTLKLVYAEKLSMDKWRHNTDQKKPKNRPEQPSIKFSISETFFSQC